MSAKLPDRRTLLASPALLLARPKSSQAASQSDAPSGSDASPEGAGMTEDERLRLFAQEMEEDGTDRSLLDVSRPRWSQILDPSLKPPVSWASDSSSPDYLHLEEGSRTEDFAVTRRHIEQLAAANSFALPRDAPAVIFGLRGCALVSRPGVFSASLAIREAVPDHLECKCVIGVLRPEDGRLAGFPASTVPNVDYMFVQLEERAARRCNLLPTGLHRYAVGVHRGNLPAALRQMDPVAVLRTKDDLQYAAVDEWDPGLPFDNMHAAYSFSKPPFFSSAGCQVIPGGFDRTAMRPTGQWAAFSRAIGLDDPPQYTDGLGTRQDGAVYHYMLLTGREARLAAAGRVMPALRYGSSGEAAAALQDRLGVRPERPGVVDRPTLRALAAWQQQASGRATGMLSAKDAQALGVKL